MAVLKFLWKHAELKVKIGLNRGIKVLSGNLLTSSFSGEEIHEIELSVLVVKILLPSDFDVLYQGLSAIPTSRALFVGYPSRGYTEKCLSHVRSCLFYGILNQGKEVSLPSASSHFPDFTVFR